MNSFNTLATGLVLFSTSSAAIKPEKKEDTTMLPNYTVKSAGSALKGTPFAYWYFLFEDSQKKPLLGFANYYDAMHRKAELQQKATETFAYQLLRTDAMKEVADLDVKVVSKLVSERKDADAEKAKLEAETKKLETAKKAKDVFFTKATVDFDDEDLFV